MIVKTFDGSFCPHCQVGVGAPDWKAKKTYLWANQYGYSCRIFCENCGVWTDYKGRYVWDGLAIEITRYKRPDSDKWHEVEKVRSYVRRYVNKDDNLQANNKGGLIDIPF